MLLRVSRIEGHKKLAPMHLFDSAAILAELQAKDPKATPADAAAEARKRCADYVAQHEGAAGDPPAYEMQVDETPDPAPAAPPAASAPAAGK